MVTAATAAPLADAAFDTTRPGRTSATGWVDACAELPRFAVPRGWAVWVVAPHPDDESLGVGGLIAACARADIEVHVVAVTDGEAAYGRQDAALGRRRRAEMADALLRLGVPPGCLARLGLPDGGVAAHEGTLTEWLAARLTPRALVVGPFERDGHPDHDATGRACRAASAARGASRRSYPIWAMHRCTPAQLLNEKPERFDLDPADRSAKRAAVASHSSQLRGEPGRPPVVPGHVRALFELDFEVLLP